MEWKAGPRLWHLCCAPSACTRVCRYARTHTPRASKSTRTPPSINCSRQYSTVRPAGGKSTKDKVLSGFGWQGRRSCWEPVSWCFQTCLQNGTTCSWAGRSLFDSWPRLNTEFSHCCLQQGPQLDVSREAQLCHSAC